MTKNKTRGKFTIERTYKACIDDVWSLMDNQARYRILVGSRWIQHEGSEA